MPIRDDARGQTRTRENAARHARMCGDSAAQEHGAQRVSSGARPRDKPRAARDGAVACSKFFEKTSCIPALVSRKIASCGGCTPHTIEYKGGSPGGSPARMEGSKRATARPSIFYCAADYAGKRA